MTLASLAASRFPVRADLVEANREGFAWIGASGTWWSGAERVAIAGAAREAAHCALCRARKQALTPAASIHCGYSATGLPIGLQIAGQRFDDLGVLQIAHAFEQLRGPQRPWPQPPE